MDSDRDELVEDPEGGFAFPFGEPFDIRFTCEAPPGGGLRMADLARHLIETTCPTGVVELAWDDTLFHHDGRKVGGAGVFRDEVRSTIGRVAYAHDLNPVVITLRVAPPWGGRPIAVPVNARPHHRNDATTTIARAAAMKRPPSRPKVADYHANRFLRPGFAA